MLMSSTTCITAQNVPGFIPTDSLLAAYTFSSNANDISGNNFHGTVSGASMSADRNGVSNSSYYFDGVNDYISLPEISTDFIAAGKSGSISFWFKGGGNCTSNCTGRIVHIAGGSQWAIIAEITKDIPSTSGARPKVYFRCPNENNEPLSSQVVNTNSWNHVIISIDGSTGNYKYYYNGTLLSDMSFTYSTSNTYYTSGRTINVGHTPGASGGANTNFLGNIDDLFFWSKALDSVDVFHIYNEINYCQDSLLAQPSSNTFQTIPGNAHFTTAHSDTSATYQWQQNNGTGWANLSDFGIYSGTTTDSLVMTGITTTLNGYGYRCVIDACTMDTTDVAFLTVVDNVGIDEDEATITIAPNPTSGIVTIGLNSAAEYKVFNVNGQVVAKGKTDGQIDLTNLPSGSYQLILDSEDGSTVHSIQKI